MEKTIDFDIDLKIRHSFSDLSIICIPVIHLKTYQSFSDLSIIYIISIIRRLKFLTDPVSQSFLLSKLPNPSFSISFFFFLRQIKRRLNVSTYCVRCFKIITPRLPSTSAKHSHQRLYQLFQRSGHPDILTGRLVPYEHHVVVEVDDGVAQFVHLADYTSININERQ